MCLKIKSAVCRPNDVSMITLYGVRRIEKDRSGNAVVKSPFNSYVWKFGDNRVTEMTMDIRGDEVHRGVFHLMADKDAAAEAARALSEQERGTMFAVVPVEVRWCDIRWVGICHNVNVPGMDGSIGFAVLRCCWDGSGDTYEEGIFFDDDMLLIDID